MNPNQKTFTTLAFILAFSGMTFAQTESLNQKDANGKPHGKWMVYWNHAWEKTDSLHAKYRWYTYYDHGKNLCPMGPRSTRWIAEKKDRAQPSPELLDGEYRWYDNHGRLRSTDVFAKGQYISHTWYYSSGQIEQFFDYTKNWNNQPHSWYLATYKKQGQLKYGGYFRKGEKGDWFMYCPR